MKEEMEISQDYCGLISENVDKKLNFLTESLREIQGSVRIVSKSCDETTRVNKKKKIVSSPTWLRIRPVRRSYKHPSDDSESDPDYEPESPSEGTHRANTSYKEPLENIERRLGIPKKPNQYGAIEGAHRPTVAGIHPGPEGAYSVALSGGYEGDWDLGDEFTYTGEGGRDLKGTKDKPKNLRTAPQSKDQTLTRGNLALHKSFENGIPVRVIRGYKLQGRFAPPDGYRYDGLYKVTKCWTCTGKAGYLLYKFHFTRLENQLPLIDSIDSIMLFSSIKTKEITRNETRRHSSRKRNSSVSFSCDYNSEDESEIESVQTSTKQYENFECNTMVDQVSCVEIEESLPMFQRGRFLGFEESSQHCDDFLEAFDVLLTMIESKALDVVSSKLPIEDELADSEGNNESNSINALDDSKSDRRKNQVPRKVIRLRKS